MTAPDAAPLTDDDLAALERGLAGVVRCNECGATDGLTPSGGGCGEEAVHRNCPKLRGGPWAPDALADRTYALPSREQAVALVAELRASQEREAAAYRRGREAMRAEAVAACVAVGADLRDGAEADGTDDEGRAQQAAAEDCAAEVRALPVDG